MGSNSDYRPKRFDPAPFNNLLGQMDAFFNESIKNYNSFFNKRPIIVDMYETKSDVVIEAELPGYKRDQIQLEISGNQLRISAENYHQLEEKNDKHKFFNREQSVERVERLVTLPFTISKKDTRASLNDGILKIYVRKKNSSRKFIDIDADE